MSQLIPGLGIDMGPPSVDTRDTRRRPQSMDSASAQEFTASLNQYNSNRRSQSHLPVRRPTTASTLSERKVRIASGQPGILGSQSDEEKYAPAPMDRNRRLSLAVAAIADQDWDHSSDADANTPSDLYTSDSSPTTDSTLSSNATSLRRNMTVRKQRSQPDFTKQSTLDKSETVSRPLSVAHLSHGAPRAMSSGMTRSKSSIILGSKSNLDSGSEAGSTSLGRSKEIPRSGSRHARGGSSRGRHARSATWDPRSAAAAMADQNDTTSGLVPDGFGGYTTADEATTPVELPREIAIEVSPLKRSASQPSIAASIAPQQASRPLPVQPNTSSASETPSQILALKVGSFYGPDGSERARLDEDGRLSSVGSSYGPSAPQSVISMSSAPSQRSRAQSHSGPRPQFMASPAVRAGAMSGAEIGAEDSRPLSSGSQLSQPTSNLPMRSYSQKLYRGLEGAEKGEAMVSLDSFNETFSQGDQILPTGIKAAAQGRNQAAPTRPAPHSFDSERLLSDASHARRQSAPAYPSQTAPMLSRSMTDAMGRANASQLERQNTLISTTANPARRAKELNRLLAHSGRKLTSASAEEGAASAPTNPLALTTTVSRSSTIADMPPATLEQGRSGKNRVDVDLVLESDLVVEGGYLRGRLEIKVRKSSDKDGPLMLTQPKVRVVGFEELLNDDTRHIFYHHATVIDGSPRVGNGASQPYVLHGAPSLSPQADNRRPLPCFASSADSEGYCVAKEGSHSVPFAMELPVGKGAKGSYRGKHAIVRYIVIGSVKLKSANGANRSIAHFYRHVELYPYLNPAVVLSSSARPIQASASKGLFLGGTGKVHLSASLHRSTWIAGQRVYVNIKIDNETSKKVKSLTLALVRTVTLFRPRPEFDVPSAGDTYNDPDACTTSTSRKKISEEVLEMGQKGTKGVVTARGWWTGVDGGDVVEISHNMKLPVDALTITRGRHVEVLYSIKASINSSLSSDVSVELPLRVVNFVSLDPPPLKSSCTKVTRNWTQENHHQHSVQSEPEGPRIERMKYLEASRSPLNRSAGLGLEPANQRLHSSQAEQPPQTESRLDVPGGDKRLQHQKSLDFINHAIRSATARKTRSNEPSPMGLGIELDDNRTPPTDSSYYSSASSSSGASIISSVVEAIDPSCAPYTHPAAPTQRGDGLYQHPVNLPIVGGTLHDVGDDTYDELGYGNQTLNLNEESVDEVDFVIGSAQLDGGESSPAFQQRQDFGRDDYETRYEDEEGDLSSSTVTSQRGIREEEEYDEEEERLEHQQRAANGAALVVPAVDLDNETTPLAHSPPKFASGAPSNRLPTQSKGGKTSLPRMRIHIENSEDEYSSSTSTSSRRSVVRTKSDQECRLGRSSTIIKGPSGNMSRPVSPSKQAASPTKSALKSGRSFGPMSSSNQSSSCQSVTAPPTLRAKVSYSQISSATAASQKVSPAKKQIWHTDESDSCSSASPASSVSVLTPENVHSELMEDGADICEHDHSDDTRDSGSALGLSDLPLRSGPLGDHGRGLSVSAIPSSKSLPSLPRSTSVHSLQGSTIIVPSVRDKVAMLESRKQALRDFTGSCSPGSNSNNNSVSANNTPSKLGTSNSRLFHNDTTPTRNTSQAAAANNAARHLQRNNSILSDVSSQADYLRHTPSIAEFKAPLLNTR